METDQYHQSQALQLTVSENDFFAVQALQYNSITVFQKLKTRQQSL